MIVRELLDNPSLIENFDFFNDYFDTKWWLWNIRTTQADDVVVILQAGYEKWTKEWNKNDYSSR